MPIEIRELIIKAQINDQQGVAGNSAKLDKKQKQLIIQECVEQVLEILKERKER